MHAIGAIHEQARPDRNDHVVIEWDNIRSNQRHNFRCLKWDTDNENSTDERRNTPPNYDNNYDQCDRGIVKQQNLPYDYNSVMHYPFYAGSRWVSESWMRDFAAIWWLARQDKLLILRPNCCFSWVDRTGRREDEKSLSRPAWPKCKPLVYPWIASELHWTIVASINSSE